MSKSDTTTRFNADISELKSAFQEASRQIKLANSEFKAASSGMEDWNKSADGVTAKLSQLDKVLDAQKKQLKSLTDQYELTVKEYGENSAAAENLKIKINNQQAAINATQQQINSYNQQLSDMQSETKKTESAADELESTFKSTDTTVKNASEGFTVMKSVLADLVSAGIQAAIQGFKDLAKYAKESYDEFHSGMNNVITATGATGEAAEGLKESYKNVAKSVKGDMSEIGSTLGEVNTRFAYTGEKLEKTTEDFMKFASITGTDAVSAVQLVSRAMGDAGIESDEYGKVLDELAIAAQASGISVDKLAENLTKYGAPMRALGFDTKESISIFSAWEKAGVNTEIAFSGMKKAISNWSAAGKDSKEEFKKTLDEIAKAPDIAAATTKAIEIFGAKAGPDLADAIQNGRFEFSEFLDIVSDSKGTVENTYNATQDAFDRIALAAQGLKADVGEEFSNLLSEYEPEIQKAVEVVKGFISNGISFLTTEVIPKIKDFISNVSQFVSDHEAEINQFKETIKGYISNAVDFLKTEIIPKIQDFISGISQFISDHKEEINKFIETIKGYISAVVDFLATEVIPRVKDFASWCIEHLPLIEAAIGGILTAIAAFKAVTFMQSVITAFKTLATVIQAAGIKQAILNALMAANPVGLIVAAIAGLVAAFVILWNKSEAFRNFWIGLWDSIQETLYGFFDFFVNSWNKVKSFFSVTVTFFKSLWIGFKVTIENALTAIADFFINTWENLKSGWNTVGEFFKTVWNGFTGAIQTAWNAVSDFFINSWESIKNSWSAVGEFFKNIWDGFMGAIQTAWNAVSDFFINSWESIKNSWSAVGEFFKTVWNSFTGTIQTVWNAVLNFFVTSWETLKSGWSAVGEFFKTIWNGFTGAIQTAWNTVSNFFVTSWETLKNGWSAVGDFFKDIWNGFTGAIQTLWQAVSDFFINSWESIKNSWSAVGEFFKSIWNGFTDSIVSVWQTISDFFIGSWESLKAVWNLVGEFFKSVWNSFTDSIVSGWQTVADFFVSAWESLKTGVSETWDSIKSILETVSDWFDETIIIPVSTFFSNMWDNLVAGATLAWEGIKTVFSVITEWFGNKFTEAWTAVKNVFSTGGQIFDGIKEGITSAFKTVVNAIIRGINKVVSIPFNAINNVLDRLRNLSIMDIQPFGWLSDISVPKIPELREGGVLKKGKIGFLEGDGDEAVVPLEKNTRWIDEVSARISRNIGVSNQYSSNTDNHSVTNNFYQTNNSPKALSRLEIYRQSRNLLKTLG